jgi:hypothetical protein
MEMTFTRRHFSFLDVAELAVPVEFCASVRAVDVEFRAEVEVEVSPPRGVGCLAVAAQVDIESKV